MKKTKLIYRIVTILFSLMVSMAVVMYFVKYDMVAETLTSIGYPVYLIYPLAAVKTLGLVAIWTDKSAILKEWAYAGFTFVLLLAASAHYNVGDGQFGAPLFELVLLYVSYFFYKKLEKEA